MSDVVQEGGAANVGATGAPAVAANDPSVLSGPGVTQNPDNADQVFDLAAVAEENARLRAQLIEENERLKAALADSRLAGAALQGLSDEDVRRIEHPEEYVAEFAALGEHEALTALVGSLSQRLDAAERASANVNNERAQLAATPAQPAPRESVGVTADPIGDGSQQFTGTGVGEPHTGAIVGDEPAVVADSQGVDLATLTDAQLADELARRESAGNGS